MSDLAQRVDAEIRSLHAEFERWLRGEGSRDYFDRIRSALADDFTFVAPNGDIVERDQLLADLANGWGARQIRIRIEATEVRWASEQHTLATYEEWHDHDDYTTARVSTVLFEANDDAPHGLVWRHVHETWKIRPPSHSV